MHIKCASFAPSSDMFAKLCLESEESMRRKTKRQTKIQKNEVTKIRVFMKGVTKATPKMINKAQQAAMHYMNVRNAAEGADGAKDHPVDGRPKATLGTGRRKGG